uniref:CCHC-type domain-containing protein n=1 Tax=Arundo donax TaxID=35708 RepID=A0A0A9CGL7_ARUDO
MHTRLIKLINRIRAFGSKNWSDHKVVKRLLRAFSVRNLTLTTIIRKDPDFKRMTPDDVLGQICHYELMEQEAQHVKQLSKLNLSAKNKEAALKASKKSKGKEKEVEESNDDESFDSEDALSLFMKKLKKFMKKEGGNKKRDKKDKTKTKRTKRPCYNCGKVGHFIADCSHPKKDKEEETKDDKSHKHEKKKTHKEKHSGQVHVGEE